MLQEMQLTASALASPPPLKLRAGYANEEGMAGMPPASGWLEVVNKSERRDGESIAILAGVNVVEMLSGRAVSGLMLDECLRRGVMEDHTVMCAEIDKSVTTLQVISTATATNSSKTGKPVAARRHGRSHGHVRRD